jgi:hypothetical protein
MNVLLMDPARRFDWQAEAPAEAEELIFDLELDALFEAMAAGDPFLRDVARAAILHAPRELEAIRWRQHVLDDCLANPEVIERIYRLALEAIDRERREWGFFLDSPEAMLSRSVRVLYAFAELLGQLRRIAEEHQEELPSPGFQRLFAMLREQLSEDYLERVRGQLGLLEFKRGALVGARLASGLKGADHQLHEPREQSLLERLSPFQRDRLSFQIADRDQAGQRALSELLNRGVASAAGALGESVAHILSFFRSLAAELAFYRGALNLRARLAELQAPVCMPEPAPLGSMRLTARGLYDPCLALVSGERPVASDLDADGRALIVITGANRGGKSTFLRSLGVAQLMMQSGLFVAAERFCAEVRDRVFTHFKREEDEQLERGKLDEELARMARIAGALTNASMLLCNESFASTNELEGSEIGRQLVRALVEGGVRVGYVTHFYDLAASLRLEHGERALFLRASPDANFRLREGEPLPTSHGVEVFARVFGEPPG